MKNIFFSKIYYKKWLGKASDPIQKWFQEETNYLKNNIKPGTKILDVGCGFGRHITTLRESADEIVGIDNNRDLIQEAKRNLGSYKNVELFLQDVRNLNLKDNYFDYVICMTNTFGNLGSKDFEHDALNEMLRVCKKGGKVIISVYSDKAIKVRKRDYENVGLHITKMEDDTIYTEEGLISKHFNKFQFTEFLRKFKIKNVRISELDDIALLCELTK